MYTKRASKEPSALARIPYSSLVFLYLCTSAILRLVLWGVYGLDAHVTMIKLPIILAVGVIQDILALTAVLLPISLLGLLPLRFIRSSFARHVAALGCFGLIYFFLFLGPAEFLFFDEFNSRFNLVAVDYFAYPTEVVGNIRESYPMGWLLSGLGLLSALCWKFVWPGLRPFFMDKSSHRSPKLRAILHLCFVVIFFTFGSIDLLTRTANRVQSEIAQNGVLTFLQAIVTNDIEFDHFYATLDRPKAFQIMRDVLGKKGGEFVSSDPFNLTRRFSGSPTGFGKINVVMIGEESLGAQYISALGDPRGLTPFLDSLSKEALLFRNAYATGTRTVRGLEALSMSLPPIPSESTVKRPGNEGMANIGQVLAQHGYQPSFLYGGFGRFDNMNYFFGNNGFALSDRLDIKNPMFGNIWGVSDEDLFHHAVGYFDDLTAQQKPFFSLIMTTSNHKPFTFREGVPGVPSSGGGREAGVRYADFALSKFFAEAKTHSWYSNTLFIIVGDHDSRVYGRAQLPVERFKVALIMFAPGRLSPAVIDTVTSHIDIAPTILGLLGLPYEAPFYGRNVLDPNTPATQPVLLNHNHNVGYFDNGILALTGLNRVQTTYSVNADKTQEIAPDQARLDELTAYLQTAYELYREKRYVLASSAAVSTQITNATGVGGTEPQQ